MIVTRFLVLALVAGLSLVPVMAAAIDPQAAAQRVDALLSAEGLGSADGQSEVAPAADDATLLRRMALDATGVPPTPEEIGAYALDTSPGKRAAAVDQLLQSPEFGKNWGRYWRDVIMARRSEDRAVRMSATLEKFLARHFNDVKPRWDAVAAEFITAEGDIRDEGATAIIMAQMGNPEDTTAEISRIFLGIQIQCAQCHDHPTDRWQREQFHELAAFFPRIAIRPVVEEGKRRSFAVVASDKGPKRRVNMNGRRGSLEHYMPDLDHPESEGTLIRPVFFVTGNKLNVGTKDAKRRGQIAEWITGRENPWFAKAYVNRMWAELVGRGFYEPVDDIGPDRVCAAPDTLDYLSEQFADNEYDVKWLMRAIMATDAYARQSRSRYDEQTAPFAASCPQRLRGDQLYNALAVALDLGDKRVDNKAKRAATEAAARGRLNQQFGYDPSEPRDEVAGSIPQALFLMNAPEIDRALGSGERDTMLNRLLADVAENDAAIEELYLRCLARAPNDEELATCLEYIQSVGNRGEAFEDIAWSLVNSTEFLHRK